MRKIIIYLLVQSICILSIAQSYTSQSNPTLNFLYNNNIEVSQISNTDNMVLFPLVVGNKQAELKIIRNKKGLFALVNGTGQVYKASNLADNMITFTRIDSTKFFGHNFESINYSYKNIIYNFGGYGFWHANGQLSYFTEGGEWTIEKINEEYQTFNKLFSYNTKNNKIYFVEYPRTETHTNSTNNETRVIQFDLVNNQNQVLGLLNPKINFSWKYFRVNTPSLDGIISYDTGEIYLYQFNENKVFKLNSKGIKQKLGGKAGAETVNNFEYNGTLYYSYSNDTTLRTLKITIKDFTLLDYPIYIKDTQLNTYWIITILIGLFIFLGVGIFFIRKKKKNTTVQQADEPPIYETDLSSNEFSDIEKAIISKLIEKSTNNSYLNVEDFNAYLGIKKKTIEIQKRVRTEAINRINHKFNVNFSKETVFIERNRSNEDRRYFNYVINKENASIYLAVKHNNLPPSSTLK